MFQRVDIQLHTSCNRKCPWCIFKYYDIPVNIMNIETFENILEYIKTNYDSFEKPIFFVLHKFFEPLLYPELLFERTKRIKEVFPDSIIKINSNCDFLNKDTVYSLQYIDRLSIPNYANVKNLLNLCSIQTIDKNDSSLLISYINNTKITIHTNGLNVFSRGSVLHHNCKNYQFNKNNNIDCNIFGKFLSIAYDGSIMPCYDTVPYINLHESIVLGNINDKHFSFPEFINIQSHNCCKYCNADISKCI